MGRDDDIDDLIRDAMLGIDDEPTTRDSDADDLNRDAALGLDD